MKDIYLFYDELGKVYLTYYIEPHSSLLRKNHVIVKDEEIKFEEKKGMFYELFIDLETKSPYPEYFEIPQQPITVEEELKILKEENAQITYALMMEGIL